jgi:hypothetical protein
MTWLDNFLNQHRELEAPMNFWFWAALSSISATVKDNVYLSRQIYNCYPNIYVMFHADSGLKKGPPISAAKQMVRAVGQTRIISGRSSIQGILKDLGTAFTVPGGKPLMKSVAFICSSELTSSIVEDKVATDILTDLYDRNYNIGEWRSLLKMETFNLKDPTITMLTATNEAHSTDFFGKKDIHGGYFARTFIVSEHKRNRSNSLSVRLKNPPNYQQSAEYLKDLAKLHGEFEPIGMDTLKPPWVYPMVDRETGETQFFTEAGLTFEKWYADFNNVIESNEIKDDTGTLNRFGDSVLKVAMLLSLAKTTDLVIDNDCMNSAITYCEKLIGNVREMTHGKKGISQAKLLKGLIIKMFLERDSHQISRQLLMKKMWSHYADSDEFDEIMLSFDSAGMIKTESVGNQIIYVMPESEVEELKKHFAGKNR